MRRRRGTGWRRIALLTSSDMCGVMARGQLALYPDLRALAASMDVLGNHLKHGKVGVDGEEEMRRASAAPQASRMRGRSDGSSTCLDVARPDKAKSGASREYTRREGGSGQGADADAGSAAKPARDGTSSRPPAMASRARMPCCLARWVCRALPVRKGRGSSDAGWIKSDSSQRFGVWCG